MRRITFEPDAFRDFNEWATDNKKTYKKICKLIESIYRTPFEGDGKPEPLKYKKTGYWSRRINLKDRLIYKANDNEIVIIRCKGHYS